MASIPRATRGRLLTETAHRCCKCYRDTREADIHHITPTTKGGLDDYENLIILCPACHGDANRDNMPSSQLKMYRERWIYACTRILFRKGDDYYPANADARRYQFRVPSSSTRCPVCKVPLSGDKDIVMCNVCYTLMHLHCAEHRGGLCPNLCKARVSFQKKDRKIIVDISSHSPDELARLIDGLFEKGLFESQ
jgi:hypothetical protein